MNEKTNWYMDISYSNTYPTVAVEFSSPSFNVHVCNFCSIFYISHHKIRNGPLPERGRAKTG